MTVMKRRFLACALVLCGLSASHRGFAQERFHYEPAIVELSGKVTIESHYGPPGYGETPRTDAKENVPVLDLDASIAVQGDDKSDINRDAFDGVSRIQLIDLRKLNLIAVVGRRVRVLGALFEGHTGHHHTDVLMDVQQVTPLD